MSYKRIKKQYLEQHPQQHQYEKQELQQQQGQNEVVIQQYPNLDSSSYQSSQYDLSPHQLEYLQNQYIKKKQNQKAKHKRKHYTKQQQYHNRNSSHNSQYQNEQRSANNNIKYYNHQYYINKNKNNNYNMHDKSSKLDSTYINFTNNDVQTSFISKRQKQQKSKDYQNQNSQHFINISNHQINNHNNFNMNSFLNAAPNPFFRKGKPILGQKQMYSTRNENNYIHQNHKIKQQSIQLVTIPEIQPIINNYPIQSKRKYLKSNTKNHKSLIQDQNQMRFKSAKLNFYDSFLPQGMKIKKSPYLMMKYIQSSNPISKFNLY